MRRNFHLTALLLALALFCAACGARMPGEKDGESPSQTLPVVVTDPEDTAPPPVTEPSSAGTMDPVSQLPVEPDAVDAGSEAPEDGSPEGDAPQEDGTPETGAADLSGMYTDKQGTEDIYSELELVQQGDGITYDVSIGLYRLCLLEGLAQVQEDGTLAFVGGPPDVKAVITIDGEQAEVEITVSEFEYLHPGDVFQFPDGRE